MDIDFDKLITFRDLPGIADLESRYQEALQNRLFRDELDELEKALEQKSLELFGITVDDTLQDPANPYSQSTDEWEQNFEFLDWMFYEEQGFWWSAGLDMTDGEGEPLGLIGAFGRQLVCAIREIHPKVTMTFKEGGLSPAQVDAAAEAWGKALLRRRD